MRLSVPSIPQSIIGAKLSSRGGVKSSPPWPSTEPYPRPTGPESSSHSPHSSSTGQSSPLACTSSALQSLAAQAAPSLFHRGTYT